MTTLMMKIWKMIIQYLSQYWVQVFWGLVVLLVILFAFPSFSNADEGHDTQTSGQLLNNKGFEANTNSTSPTNWTKNGDVYVCNTCGPAGGNALKTGNDRSDPKGGIVSQTIDLFNEMTQAQINHGFDLNYEADVYSHSSNATVPACAATEGDCRDTFEINITITDSVGTVLNTFSQRYEEITWSGWDRNTYTFTSTVPENEYTSALATFSLFGVDSGITTNNQYGGPRFDNVSLTATYATTAALEAMEAALNTVLDSIDITNDTGVLEVVVTDPVGNEIVTESVGMAELVPVVPATPTMESNIEPPTLDTGVESSEPAAEVETQMAEVEAEVEAEVAAEIKETSGDSSEDSKSSDKSSKSKSEKKKKIATRIVAKIIQKMDQSAASQAVQLALMNSIGANINTGAPQLQDASTWYASTDIYNTTQLIDPYSAILDLQQGALMNSLIESQYR